MQIAAGKTTANDNASPAHGPLKPPFRLKTALSEDASSGLGIRHGRIVVTNDEDHLFVIVVRTQLNLFIEVTDINLSGVPPLQASNALSAAVKEARKDGAPVDSVDFTDIIGRDADESAVTQKAQQIARIAVPALAELGLAVTDHEGPKWEGDRCKLILRVSDA
ncbi:MAG: hypothetical protein AAFR65_02810 [Pseudomonadota bacterium]